MSPNYVQPAFPTGQDQADGMSLRDYFAAKAMQGLADGTLCIDMIHAVALTAYDYADAMLKARQQ